jgi:hypothetical protein
MPHDGRQSKDQWLPRPWSTRPTTYRPLRPLNQGRQLGRRASPLAIVVPPLGETRYALTERGAIMAIRRIVAIWSGTTNDGAAETLGNITNVCTPCLPNPPSGLRFHSCCRFEMFTQTSTKKIATRTDYRGREGRAGQESVTVVNDSEADRPRSPLQAGFLSDPPGSPNGIRIRVSTLRELIRPFQGVTASYIQAAQEGCI